MIGAMFGGEPGFDARLVVIVDVQNHRFLFQLGDRDAELFRDALKFGLRERGAFGGVAGFAEAERSVPGSEEKFAHHARRRSFRIAINDERTRLPVIAEISPPDVDGFFVHQIAQFVFSDLLFVVVVGGGDGLRDLDDGGGIYPRRAD